MTAYGDSTLWECVDEVVADDDTTYIRQTYCWPSAFGTATFNLTAIVDTPEVTTNPADDIDYYSATLNGTLDEDTGVACTCGFDYGLTIDYGTEISRN